MTFRPLGLYISPPQLPTPRRTSDLRRLPTLAPFPTFPALGGTTDLLDPANQIDFFSRPVDSSMQPFSTGEPDGEISFTVATAGVRTTPNSCLSAAPITSAFEPLYRLLQQSKPTPFSQPSFTPPTYWLPTFIAVLGTYLKHKRDVKTWEQCKSKPSPDPGLGQRHGQNSRGGTNGTDEIKGLAC